MYKVMLSFASRGCVKPVTGTGCTSVDIGVNAKPSHRVCKAAYLVPFPSQDKLGGLCQEGHLAKWWRWQRLGCQLVGWGGSPSVLLVRLPVLSSFCSRKSRRWQPSWNATKPCARVQSCVSDDLRADGLRKGWGFQVGTWNVDSLTGRAGEVVEVLSNRKVEMACIQET